MTEKKKKRFVCYMLKKLKRFFYEENFTHNINLCIMKQPKFMHYESSS